MAVKRALATLFLRPGDMWSYLGDDGWSEGQVWNKHAVHDVDVDPVAAVLHEIDAFLADFGKVGGED